jgi:hypothetical protein
MQPYKCPVCDGTGKVPAGFYSNGYGSTNACPEQCQTCKGIGIVWAAVFIPSVFDHSPLNSETGFPATETTTAGSKIYRG